MKDFLIKCESEEHGKKIVDYIKSLGIDTRLGGNSVGDYYGVIDGVSLMHEDFSMSNHPISIVTTLEDLMANQIKPQPKVKGKPNAESLRLIAVYLSGIKEGKGNLLPLGNADLDELWKAIDFLNEPQ